MASPRKILIIQAHPDNSEPHLCHALAASYEAGATAGGHEVRTVDLSKLDFPMLRSQKEWEHGKVPPSLEQAQQDILWSDHIVFCFPLWLGDMPALLKAFLEQVARPGFAFRSGAGLFKEKALAGRSARVVVTMGMPASVYRFFFRAHSIKSLERNVLGFVGISPVHETLVGLAGNLRPDDAAKWLQRVHALGAGAQ
jgi:putative NADPH-quinone reductase